MSDFNATYYIVAGGNGQYSGGIITLGGTDYELTSTDSASGATADAIDNDGAIASGVDSDFDGKPYVEIMTGSLGNVRHAYDFGFRELASCVNPTVTAFAIQPSCIDNVVQSDGYLQLSAIIDGNRYHYSEGISFDDNGGANTYTNATDTSGLTFPIEFTTEQTNPSGSRDYTIRVYNGANDYYLNVVI